MGDPVRDYLGEAQQPAQSADPVAEYLNAPPSQGVSADSGLGMPADQLSARGQRTQQVDPNEQIKQLQAMRDQPGVSSEKRIEINKAIDKLQHPILYGLTGYVGNYSNRDWIENAARGVIGGAIANGVLGTADLIGAGLQLALPKAAEDAIGLGKAREDLAKHRQYILDKADAEGVAGALGNVAGSFGVGAGTFGKISHGTAKAILRYGPSSPVARVLVRGMAPGASYVERLAANLIGNVAVDGVQIADIATNDQLNDKEKIQQIMLAAGLSAGSTAAFSLLKNKGAVNVPNGDNPREVTLDTGTGDQTPPSQNATQAAAELDAKIARAAANAKAARGASRWWNKLTPEQRAQHVPGIEQEVADKRFNQLPDAWQQKVIDADQARRPKPKIKPAGSEQASTPAQDGSVGQPTTDGQMPSDAGGQVPGQTYVPDTDIPTIASRLTEPEIQKILDGVSKAMPQFSRDIHEDHLRRAIEGAKQSNAEDVQRVRDALNTAREQGISTPPYDMVDESAQVDASNSNLNNSQNPVERAQRQRKLFEQINKAVEQRDLAAVKRLREELDALTGQGSDNPPPTSSSPRPTEPTEPSSAEGAPPASGEPLKIDTSKPFVDEDGNKVTKEDLEQRGADQDAVDDYLNNLDNSAPEEDVPEQSAREKIYGADGLGATLLEDVIDPANVDENGDPRIIARRGDKVTMSMLDEMREAGLEKINTSRGILNPFHEDYVKGSNIADENAEAWWNNGYNPSGQEKVFGPDSPNLDKTWKELTPEEQQRVKDWLAGKTPEHEAEAKANAERMEIEKQIDDLTAQILKNIDARSKMLEDGPGEDYDNHPEYQRLKKEYNDLIVQRNRLENQLRKMDGKPTDEELDPDNPPYELTDEWLNESNDRRDASRQPREPEVEQKIGEWWDSLTNQERDDLVGDDEDVDTTGFHTAKWEDLFDQQKGIVRSLFDRYGWQGNGSRPNNRSSAPQSPDEAIDALLRDVEDRYQQKRHNAELERRLNDAERIAFTDELTKVGNRHLLRRILGLAEGEDIANAHAPKGKKFVLVDVKNLGAANEIKGGQAAGDGYLIYITEAIKQALDYVGVDRADANIMRIGGDEFVVLVNADDASVLSSSIKDHVGEPPLGDKHVGGVYTAEGEKFGDVAEKLARVKDADPTRIKNIIKEQLKKGQQKPKFGSKQNPDGIWSGLIDTRDNFVEETYTYRQADEADFHHQMLVPPEYNERMNNGEVVYWFLDKNGEPQAFRGELSPEAKESIKRKINPDQRTPEQLSHKDQTGPVTKEDQPLETVEVKKPLEDHTEDELDKLIDKLDTVEEKDPSKADAVGRDLLKISQARRGIRAAADKARVKPAEQLPQEAKPVLEKDAALANQGKQVEPDKIRARKLLSTKPKAMSNEDLAFMATWLEAEQKRLTSAGEKQGAKDVQKKWADVMDEIRKRNEPGSGAGGTGVTLASRPEVGGAIVGFVAGYNSGDDDDPQSKIERAFAGAAIGAFAANRLARRQAAQALKELPLYQQKIREQVKSVEDGEQVRKGFWQWLNDVYTKGVRFAHPIERATTALGGDRLPFIKNPGKQASVFGLYRAMADSWLFDRPSFINADGDRSFFDALGLRTIGQMVKGDLRSLGDYWAAARALELAAQPKPRKTGIDLLAARQMFVAEFDKYHAAMLELVKYARALADVGVLSGTLSPESRAKFADVYYAPLHRLFNGELGSSPKSISTLGEKGNTAAQTPDVYKYLKGSVREILNPVEALIQNTARTLRAAEFNRVAVSLANLADAARESGNKDIADALMKRVTNVKSPITEIQIKSVKDMMDDLGTPISHEDAEKIVLTMSNETLNVQDDVLRFYRNGRLEAYKINPALAEAFKAMSPQELDNMLIPLLGEAAKKVSTAARVGITANPVFIAYQAFRDNWQFTLNSKYGFTPIIDQMRGWWQIVSKSPEYKRYIALGGSGDTIADQGLQVVRGKSATLEAVKQAQTGNVLTEAAQQFKTLHPLKAYATLVAPIADAGRFGAYLHAVGRGVEPIEAIWAAKHAGGNFSQRGSSTGLRALNLMSLFLNASLQSMDATARAVKDHPIRYGISAMAGITIPSMLLWFAYKDDQEIVDLRTSDSGRKYWWARVPMDVPGFKAGEIVKIPKPIVDGQIWGTTAEATLDKMLQNNPDAVESMARSLYNDAKFNLLPTIGVVPYSIWNNQDLQTGRKIVPDGASQLDLQYQASDNTSDAARVIGGIVAPVLSKDPTGTISPFGSPAAIDYATRGFFGTSGGDVLKGISMLLDQNRPGWTPLKNELPVVGSLFAKYPTLNVGPIQDFYNNADRADATIKTLKFLAESQPDKAQGYLDTRWDDLQTAGMYVQVRQKLADMRAAVANIQQAPDDLIPVNQKREMTQDLMRAMIDLAREANSTSRSMNQSSTK